MKQFHIFVEGNADIKFLHDYIESTFAITLKLKENAEGKIVCENITTTGGWTTLKSNKDKGDSIRDKMKENTLRGITNLIIFDSDTGKTGGGFFARKREIEAWKTTYGLTFELFLFPDNKSDGTLEDLLEHIINPQNKPIFDCWKKFEDCLPTQTTCTKNPLTIPAKKSKIYAYMEVLHGEAKSEKDKVKDPNRDYTNPQHWDLTAKALAPLKNFLRIHLI